MTKIKPLHPRLSHKRRKTNLLRRVKNLLYSDRCPVRNQKLRLRRQQEKRVPPAVAADKRMTSPAITPSKPTDKQAPTVAEDRDKLVAGASKNPSLPDPQILGRWFKALRQHASLSPAEIDLRENFQLSRNEVERLKAQLALRHREVQQQFVALQAASEQLAAAMENNGKQQQELQALTVRANQLEEKNAQWQVVTRKLQSSLKQAQHPALPATDDELADFAAGMAMGFDILGVLEQRNEQDVHVDKAAFLAGISETIRGERRLSQEEFERHLNRANQRVEDAMHKIKQQKEARDNAWLEKFRQEEGYKLRVSRPGIKSSMRESRCSRMSTLKRR
jgi:hypothetical protein